MEKKERRRKVSPDEWEKNNEIENINQGRKEEKLTKEPNSH